MTGLNAVTLAPGIAGVVANLVKKNAATGAVSTILTFDTNNNPAPGPGVQQQCVTASDPTAFGPGFIFVLDVTLTRPRGLASSPIFHGFMIDTSGCK